MNLPPVNLGPSFSPGAPGPYSQGGFGSSRPSHLVSDCSRLGPYVAGCGPGSSSPKISSYAIFGGTLLVGLLLLISIPFAGGKTPGDRAGYIKFAGIGGVLMMLGGGAMLAYEFFKPPVEVHAFGMGLVARIRDREHVIPYSSITKLTIRETYEHRGAPMQLDVTVKSKSGPTIRFDSLYRGNAQAVIQALSRSVENVVYKEWPYE